MFIDVERSAMNCEDPRHRDRKETVASPVHVNDPEFQEQGFVDLLGCKALKRGPATHMLWMRMMFSKHYPLVRT